MRWFHLQDERELYLLPIFVSSTVEIEDPVLKLFDGITHPENLKTAASLTRRILERNNNLQSDEVAESYELRLERKLLEYLYSRQKSLKAISDRSSKMGYSYPFLSSAIKQSDSSLVLQILAQSELSKHIQGKIHDRIHTCPSCEGNYLNFRETCPKCNSIDLKKEDVIHHFVCAYVGPASDFQQGDELICPKCSKRLRHIGIDFDKPSAVHHCNDCHHDFQECNMEALCIDCGDTNELGYLKERVVKNYILTEKGEKLIRQSAKLKIVRESRPLPGNVISWEFFRMILKQETFRAQEGNLRSTLGALRLKNEVVDRMKGPIKEMLHKEVLQIISSYLSPADCIVGYDISSYGIVMLDKQPQEVEELLEVIRFNLDKLLRHNIEDKSPIVFIELTPIDGKITAEGLEALVA